MSSAADYDIFISYARKDNVPNQDTYSQGWVSAIKEQILKDHRLFHSETLRIFFDCQEIKDADDWRHRILGALKASKMLLICLSPNYFASSYCRWEWDEYIKRQVHQLMGSESVATVYFIEVPSSDGQAIEHWRDELLRGNYTDLRPWFPEGAKALAKEDVRLRMARLGDTLWERLQRARRALAVPGNLRWKNPRFVGRRDELRKLHENLGTGAVGVVTAVQGLGGQGKTELAVAYAHGWADCYPAGLWSLSAEGKRELLPLIGELAWERAIGFTPSEAEKNDPALLGRGVLEHLRSRSVAVKERDPNQGAAALLLLDNVSEPELLSPAQLSSLPGGFSSGWLRILATTRLDVEPQRDRLALVTVDALDEDSALSLIRDRQPLRDSQRRLVNDPDQGQPQFASDAEEAAAREIVHTLGGFTLAVEQAAIYLGLSRSESGAAVPPSTFLAGLKEFGFLDAGAGVTTQMITQNKHLGLILDQTLAGLDSPTLTALKYAAMLAPDCVPWEWVRYLTVEVHPEVGTKDPWGGEPWQTIARRLSGLRLLTPGDHPEIARMHRLVGGHLQKMFPATAGDRGKLIRTAVAFFPDDDSTESLDKLKRVLSAFDVFMRSSDFGIDREFAMGINYRLLERLEAVHWIEDCENHWLRLLQLVVPISTDRPDLYAAAARGYGCFLRRQKKWGDAVQHYREALQHLYRQGHHWRLSQAHEILGNSYIGLLQERLGAAWLEHNDVLQLALLAGMKPRKIFELVGVQPTAEHIKSLDHLHKHPESIRLPQHPLLKNEGGKNASAIERKGCLLVILTMTILITVGAGTWMGLFGPLTTLFSLQSP